MPSQASGGLTFLKLKGPSMNLDPLKRHSDAVPLRLLIVGQEVCLHQPKVDLVDILTPAALREDLNMPFQSVIIKGLKAEPVLSSKCSLRMSRTMQNGDWQAQWFAGRIAAKSHASWDSASSNACSLR